MALPQYQGNQGDPLRNIENRFLTIINSGFQQYDLTLDQNTQASFLKLAARGATSLVQRISIEGTDPRKQEKYLEEAEKNLDRIIRLMAIQTKAGGDNIVNSKTFITVLKGVCPLWPFC